MILPVPAKEIVKMTLEETLLQGDLQMMSRIKKEIIKEFQGKKTSEVLQGTLHLPSTKVYFLDIAILVQTLGTWKKTVGHITKTNIMVPVNLVEFFFARSDDYSFMNKMECFNCHNIGHMAQECNLT